MQIERVNTAATRFQPPLMVLDDDQIAETDLLRNLGFFCCLFYIFFRFSYLHETIQMHTGISGYIPVIGAGALTLMLLSGGIRRSFKLRPMYYATAFMAWMLLAVPFSSWIGGSVHFATDVFKTEWPMMFLIGGMVTTYRQVRQVLMMLALSGAIIVVVGRTLADESVGRLTLYGGIGNSNDYAAHVLLLLPFLLYAALTRSWWFRIPALCGIVMGLYLASTTASRGGFVAFILGWLFILFKAPTRIKWTAAVGVPLFVLLALTVLPVATLARYSTLFQDNPTTSAEAAEALASKEARIYLLKQSIRYTFQNPLFGVGPGMFADYEGQHRESTRTGLWQTAHNGYTQISSECGIPALIFYLAAVFSSLGLLNSTYKTARRNPAHHIIALEAFCIMLSIILFLGFVFFLSLAYKFYMPALVGLAVAHTSAARKQMQLSVAPLATSPLDPRTPPASRGLLPRYATVPPRSELS